MRTDQSGWSRRAAHLADAGPIARAPVTGHHGDLAIYGDAGAEIIDEGHPVADGPAQMAGVAVPWEQAAAGARCERQVVLRTGIVLNPGTAAFDRLVRLTKLGLCGRIGRGDQWVSRLHIEDFLHALRFIEARADLSGVVHLTSPEPVQNREMMAGLRRELHRP